MVQRNEKGQLLPGSVLNPVGKPPGRRNFITDFEEAIQLIAKAKGESEEDVRQILVIEGYNQASKGSFSFWKEIIDRYYGKEPEKTESLVGVIDATFRDAPLAVEDAERIDRAFDAVMAVQHTVVYNPESRPRTEEAGPVGNTVSFKKPEEAPVKQIPSFGVLKRGPNGEILNELQ